MRVLFMLASSIQFFVRFCHVSQMVVFSGGDSFEKYVGLFLGYAGGVGYTVVTGYMRHMLVVTTKRSQLRMQ
jgi:uncharacterized membrane protein required for colicin V production